MTETSEAIQQKIARTEREAASLLVKARDFAAKSEECKARASELEIFVRHLKDWENSLGVTRDGTQDEDTSKMSGDERIPIKDVLADILRRHEFVTTPQMTMEVQKLYPNAKQSSIWSAISRAKKDTEIIQMGPGKYRSAVYRPPMGHTDDLDDDEEQEFAPDLLLSVLGQRNLNGFHKEFAHEGDSVKESSS